MAEEKTAKPWTIEQNSSGFVYIVDYTGKKICTVYGDEDTKIRMASAIADLPVLVSILSKRGKNE